MTTVPTTITQNPAQSGPGPGAGARPPGGGAPSAPVAGTVIDPIKLIMRHKWLLTIAAICGAGLGGVSHFAMLYLYPMFQPTVVFQANQAWSDVTKPIGAGSVQNQEELGQFMQTQVKIMTSDVVLRRVAQHPRLSKDAPKWTSSYTKNGQLDTAKVLDQLKSSVRAKTVNQTSLIELSMIWRDKVETTAIVKLAKESFMEIVQQRSNDSSKEQRDALEKGIADRQEQISSLNKKRDSLIRTKNIDAAISNQISDSARQLDAVGREIVAIQLDIKDLNERIKSMEEQLNNRSNIIQYSDRLREEVQRDPLITSLNQQVANVEADLSSMLINGMQREHREYKKRESLLSGLKQKRTEEEQRLMENKFAAELDMMRVQMKGREAQFTEFSTRQAELFRKQVELTNTQAELEDIDRQLGTANLSLSKSQDDLRQLAAVQAMATGARIIVLQQERVPDDVIFPKLVFMLPLGLILGLGAVVGFVVVRELADQRVKGPSDITMIPRTRLVGCIADAEEDPSGAGAVETAFRDRPKGVLAEQFRQLRAVLVKRMQQGGHRSLVVVSGMPGSGATSVATNVALACAGAGQRVLLIDANLRRPILHRVFNLSEGPGLSDVLAGTVAPDTAISRVADSKLAVLTAGAKDLRAYESLATDNFAAILRAYRDSFDLIIIDTAPAIVSGDGLAVANRCDASLLVVKAFNEKRGMVARIRNELTDARGEFLGVVVNGVKSAAGGYMRGNIRATHEYQNETAA